MTSFELHGAVRVTSLSHGNCKWKSGSLVVAYDPMLSAWCCKVVFTCTGVSQFKWKLRHNIQAILYKNKVLRLELLNRATVVMKDISSSPEPMIQQIEKIRDGTAALVHPMSPQRAPLTPTRVTPQKPVSPSPRRFTSMKDIGKENAAERSFLESGQQKSEEILKVALGGKNFYSANLTSTPSYGRSYAAFGITGSSTGKRKPGFMSNPETKRNRLTHVGYSWKATPTYTSEKTALQGFSNLGNTCYMNAILQSLFALDPFYRDLIALHRQTNSGANEEKRTLYTALGCLLLAKKRSNTSNDKQRHLLTNVKNAISASAKRFSGYEQHDAHEFLGQVLDQLKEEVIKINKLGLNPHLQLDIDVPLKEEPAEEPQVSPLESTFSNPTLLNFEFEVMHTITCLDCHGHLTKAECFHDLSLDMPRRKDPDKLRSIQDALDLFFLEEHIEYTCERCRSKRALVTHKFTRLPRVLVLHLKRYSFDMLTTFNHKVGRSIDIPKYLTLQPHCTDETSPAYPPLSIQAQLGAYQEVPKRVPVHKDPNDTPRRKLSFVKSSPDKQYTFKSTKPAATRDDIEELPDIPAPTPSKLRRKMQSKPLEQLSEDEIRDLPEEQQLAYALALSQAGHQDGVKSPPDRTVACTQTPQSNYTEQELRNMTEDEHMRLALETSMKEAEGESTEDSDHTQLSQSQGFDLFYDEVDGGDDLSKRCNQKAIIAGQVDGSWDISDGCQGNRVVVGGDCTLAMNNHSEQLCEDEQCRSVISKHRSISECDLSSKYNIQSLLPSYPTKTERSLCSSETDGSICMQNTSCCSSSDGYCDNHMCLSCLGLQLDGQSDFISNQGKHVNKPEECEELLNKSDASSEDPTPRKNRNPRSKTPSKSPKELIANANQPKISELWGSAHKKSRSNCRKSDRMFGDSSSDDIELIHQSDDEVVVPVMDNNRGVDRTNNNTSVHDTKNNNEEDPTTASDDSVNREEEDMVLETYEETLIPSNNIVAENEAQSGTPDFLDQLGDTRESGGKEEDFVALKSSDDRVRDVSTETQSDPDIQIRGDQTKPEIIEDSPVQRPRAKRKSDDVADDTKPTEDPDWLLKQQHDMEEEHIRKAMEASLQDQPVAPKLSDEEEIISEEEQIRRATELSLQECHMPPPMNYEEVAPEYDLVRTKEDEKKLQENAVSGRLPYSYRLMSVVSHLGSSSAAGHYVSDVCDLRKRQWFSYDDTQVSKTTELEVCRSRQQTGYIFFYLNKDVATEITDLYREVDDSKVLDRPASR